VRHFDAIVVGCGAMGSSLSYRLAEKGLRVRALEQFGLNHGFGSSHGRTRIIRLAYYEDPRYVPLLLRAFDGWRELERDSGAELLKMTGGLMVGGEEGELVPGVMRSARAHGLRCESLTAKEVGERFDAFALSDGYSAVYEESAGVLFPEKIVESFVRLAGAAGCEFGFSERVTRWSPERERIIVETDDETYSADRVAFCAGAWAGSLLGDLLPLGVERQVPFWFSSRGRESFKPGRMPVFIVEEAPGVFYYGVPELGHGVKVARSHGGKAVGPDYVDRAVTREDAVPVEEFVTRRMRGLEVPAMDSTTCLYTNTPDFHFTAGLHPDDDRLAVLGAGSGHGFKFSGVLGEVLAGLMTGQRSPYDVSFLGLERFKGQARSGTGRSPGSHQVASSRRED
jgi:sarcosine oxidase